MSEAFPTHPHGHVNRDYCPACEALWQAQWLEQENARLTAENARLREALKPFADYAARLDAEDGGLLVADEECVDVVPLNVESAITIGDCRRAREALS